MASFPDEETHDGDKEEDRDNSNDHPNRKLWRRNWKHIYISELEFQT